MTEDQIILKKARHFQMLFKADKVKLKNIRYCFWIEIFIGDIEIMISIYKDDLFTVCNLHRGNVRGLGLFGSTSECICGLLEHIKSCDLPIISLANLK